MSDPVYLRTPKQWVPDPFFGQNEMTYDQFIGRFFSIIKLYWYFIIALDNEVSIIIKFKY